MPITEHQRQQRFGYIGSSDTPVILSLSFWKNIGDLWLEKLGRLIPEVDKEYHWVANVVEPDLLKWGAAELQYKIRMNQFRVHKSKILAANLDADVLNVKGVALEAKTAGLISRFAKHVDDWGDEGTDQVPDYVLAQCQHQMLVTGKDKIWVPALIAGRGRVMFVVEADVEFQGIIMARAQEFWQHVQNRTPPPVTPTLATLKRLRREPEKTIQLDHRLVAQWAETRDRANEIMRQTKEEKEQAEAMLLMALGDAEAGDCELGRITYMEQVRKEHTVKESRFRVLRFKQDKKLLEMKG